MNQLYLLEELEYYDGVIEFSAVDSNGVFYLATARGDHTPAVDFIATAVRPAHIAAFRDGLVDIRDVMLETGRQFYYHVTINDDDSITAVRRFGPIALSADLPQPG